jgi:hypothetical protein
MKLTLKAPGSKRLKLEHDKLLSNFAFNFNLRRFILAVKRMQSFSAGLKSPNSAYLVADSDPITLACSSHNTSPRVSSDSPGVGSPTPTRGTSKLSITGIGSGGVAGFDSIEAAAAEAAVEGAEVGAYTRSHFSST